MGKTFPKVMELLSREVPAKISRNAFCRAAGINPNSFDRYKAGISEPTTATLQKMADYFEVDIDYLRDTGVYRNTDLSLEQAQTLAGVMNSAEREYLKFQQIEWRLIHMEDLKDIVAEIQRYIDSVEKLTKVRLKQKKPASSDP